MKCRKDYCDPAKYNRYRNSYNQRYYGKTAGGINANAPWSVEECEAVLAHSKTDHELAAELGRSVRSIQVCRSKLKKKLACEEG